MVFGLLCNFRISVMADLRSAPTTLGTAATSMFAQSFFMHAIAITVDGADSKWHEAQIKVLNSPTLHPFGQRMEACAKFVSPCTLRKDVAFCLASQCQLLSKEPMNGTPSGRWLPSNASPSCLVAVRTVFAARSPSAAPAPHMA